MFTNYVEKWLWYVQIHFALSVVKGGEKSIIEQCSQNKVVAIDQSYFLCQFRLIFVSGTNSEKWVHYRAC